MKAFIQIILKSLYIYSSNTSWAILSYPSKNQTLNALNVASPSLTTEYWISSFKAYDRPIFEGSFPHGRNTRVSLLMMTKDYQFQVLP